MKILCCGDRNWKSLHIIKRELVKFNNPVTIINGDANGADRLSQLAARSLNMHILTIPADWSKYGKAAGPIRNKRMLEEKPDLILAFHSDISKSKGTKNMIDISEKAGIPVHLIAK